jgi:C4-dicarboxylate-specific signal transduction histidine kinase
VEGAFRQKDLKDTFEIEHRLMRQNGDISWVITRGRYLLGGEREILELIGVTIDVTAQKQAAAQLQANREEIAHLSRVALMGEIAVSLAHELTQPLTAIMSNADVGRRLLRRNPPDLQEFRQLLTDVKADVRRAGDVVHGIRRMVKKGKTVRIPINLNEVVTGILRILNPEALLNSCELKTALEPNLPMVDGDPVELQQVLVNLIVNSIEAMHRTPSDARKVLISTQCNGSDRIEVSIRD